MACSSSGCRVTDRLSKSRSDELYVKNRKEWRLWLEKNHGNQDEIWLVYYKKHTGKPRVPYDDAVEEGLCYGWIDSIVRKMDSDRYCQKFTPRRETSSWSELNKRRVGKLMEEGRMEPAGLQKVDAAKKNGSWSRAIPSMTAFEMPSEFEDALTANKKARHFFDSLPPSSRKQFIGWIASAKRADTREKRIQEAISRLDRGERLGLK